MVRMKTNHYESQFLSGMLRASLVKIGDKVQFCQGSCLGQVPADNIQIYRQIVLPTLYLAEMEDSADGSWRDSIMDLLNFFNGGQ